MMITRRNMVLGAGAMMLPTAAGADDPQRIRIATQRSGTFSFELAIMRERGLDRAAGLELAITELASSDAGRIALRGGSADLIVTDLTFIASQRAAGEKLLFYPYSTTIGALMVPPGSSISSLKDLRGKTLGVAGGRLDKSFLLLSALARREGIDLLQEAKLAYGAPPLLSQKLAQGELDALLTWWNFAAELEARGMRRMLGVDEVQKRLGVNSPVAFLGYGFSESFAGRNRSAVDAFLDASAAAKRILADDLKAWDAIGPRLGAKTPEERALFRKLYAQGIPVDDVQARADAMRMLAIVMEAETGSFVRDEGMFYARARENAG